MNEWIKVISLADTIARTSERDQFKPIRCGRLPTHWKWRLDEVFVKINGEMYHLWKAVDHEGDRACRRVSSPTSTITKARQTLIKQGPAGWRFYQIIITINADKAIKSSLLKDSTSTDDR